MNYIAALLACYYIVKFVSVYRSNYHYWENKAFAANSNLVTKK